MPSNHSSKRAILYARVSTDEQARSGYPLAQQLEALREYAAREGYEVLEEVEDPGQSGASLERPGMDRVRDLVAAGSVSIVLAHDRDRFAREPAYHYLLKREFEEHGTKIRALNDRGDETPEGELTEGILDQLAKFARAKTAEQTRWGLPTPETRTNSARGWTHLAPRFRRRDSARLSVASGGLVLDLDLLSAHVLLDRLRILDDLFAEADLLLNHRPLLDHNLLLRDRHSHLTLASLGPGGLGLHRHAVHVPLLAPGGHRHPVPVGAHALAHPHAAGIALTGADPELLKIGRAHV